MYEGQCVALLTGGIAYRKYIQCIVITGKRRQWRIRTECFRKS